MGLLILHLNLLKEVSLMHCYTEIYINPEKSYWITLVCFMIILSLVDYGEGNSGHKEIVFCIIKYALIINYNYIFLDIRNI
jgi:hypothetical protein